MTDFSSWYNSLPFFSKYWATGTIGFTLLGRFGILKPYYLVLFLEPLKRFQIWRLLTCVLYYPLTPSTGFHFLILLYFMIHYSCKLEQDTFDRRPSDYLFLLMFNWICCVIIGLLIEMPILLDPMILSVLYIWCQLNKNVIVNFWFGTRFKAMYLPWVLLGFNMIISGQGLQELIGILVGHLYFFLKFKYPQELGGPAMIETPQILRQWFPDKMGGVHGFGVPPERRAPQQDNNRGFFRGHNWGRGHVLNGN